MIFHIVAIFCISRSYAQELSLKDCYLSNKLRETRNIVEDHLGFIWMMRGDGFYRFDGKEMEFIDVSYDLEQPFFHSGANVYSLENGDYWFAAKDAGLYFYKAKEDRFFQKDTFIIDGQPHPAYIRDVIVHPHDKDQIIVAGNKGVWIINNKFEVLKHLECKSTINGEIYFSQTYRVDEIRKLVYDQKRNLIWIGGMLGLFSYDLEQDVLIRYPVDNIKGSYKNDRDNYLINDIIIVGDQLICATWFGGLMRFDIPSEKWTSFAFEKEADALYRHGNTQIAKTKKGMFFTAHEQNVLGSWEREEQYLMLPTVDEKPVGRGIGTMVDRLGYLWVGHWTEICRYQIEAEPLQAQSSKIYIQKLLLDSNLVKQRMKRWDHQFFEFSKVDAQLQFQFRVINPLSYQGINYEYRLEGLHSDWIDNGNTEVAEFSNLEKGIYHFQVRYFDSISKKYIYSGRVKLIYTPNDLLRKYLLYGIPVILILWLLSFLIYRRFSKKRRLKAIQKYETQLREIQDAALRSQMNPHFLFNSLNSIRYFIVANDNEKAAGYLTKFSRLIRMILENSKKKSVPLADEIQLLELYVNMEQVRFEGKFDYEVSMSMGVDANNIMIPPMLIQPYIENSILHGINPKRGRGKVTLDISLKGEFLILKIIDNGIGRAKSKAMKKESLLKKESLGMSITKARLELTGYKQKARVEIIDLKNASGSGVGTEVQIWLPIG